MKKNLLLIHLLLTFLFLLIQFNSNAQIYRDTCTLIVKVSHLSSDDGKVIVALHEAGDMFPNYSIIQTKYAKIENGISYIEFKVIKKKEYAVTAHHDENENGKMDIGIMGDPMETYLMSNQAAEFIGMPKFENAMFTVELNTMLIELIKQD